MSFADDVKAAVAVLGGPEDDPVVDFLADPGAACRALDATPEHGGLVVRVAPEMGVAAVGHGPPPAAPLWIRVMRGAREVGLSGLVTMGAAMVRRAERVEIDEREERCCDAPGCEGKRAHAAVWLVLEPIAEPGSPGRLLVAEQRAREGAPVAARAVAARLATALGVPLQRDGEGVTIEPGEAPAPLGELIRTADLARFALRSEGEAVVLRDWDSAGPRASAVRNAWIGAALLAAAVAGWVQLWRSLRGGGLDGVTGVTVATGVVAALLMVAGYAFLGVARFSARYRASCAPLLVVGRDRIVVLPWVGRDGAVDTRPEGRLGAAIALGEVRGASPRPRRRQRLWGGPVVEHAVELDTEHGNIDAMVCPDAATAELWCAVLDRVIDEARHPRQGATARQRARQRAAAA